MNIFKVFDANYQTGFQFLNWPTLIITLGKSAIWLKPKTDSQFVLYFLTTSEAESFHIFFFYFISLITNWPYPSTIFLPLLELSYNAVPFFIEKCSPSNYKTL